MAHSLACSAMLTLLRMLAHSTEHCCVWSFTHSLLTIDYFCLIFKVSKTTVREARKQHFGWFYVYSLTKKKSEFVDESVTIVSLNHCVIVITLQTQPICRVFSLKVKKKYTKKWRWPSQKMEIWHMVNNDIAFIFAWKWFSNHDFLAVIAFLVSDFDDFYTGQFGGIN